MSNLTTKYSTEIRQSPVLRVFHRHTAIELTALSFHTDYTKTMPLRRFVEVEPPSPLRYIIGAAIMMLGVVLPVGYMMFRNKRVPSSSSYAKQT
ncbi:hypothetical protein RJ640_012873 [Escallonia rubra]|uniref:Uncharacterized protein n=1 Tax=Escallonia rubra TaxID=112253 RepID=A0AA88R5X6_9ASTE|nr:hypothetical protein RJ640_012873 [Escallonia rubra]